MTSRRSSARVCPSERDEQAAGVRLLRSLGAQVYTLGTRRPKGDYPGTMQTPGLPDVYVFLPPPAGVSMWWEVKRRVGGRVSEAQKTFGAHCRRTGTAHVVGDVDALIAWLVAQRYLHINQVPHYRARVA